jgi:hypothetical protein
MAADVPFADAEIRVYPDLFAFDGKRAVLFSHGEKPPRAALKHCIAMALTYRATRP